MVKQGYFDDAYLIYFVSKQCRRSPLIHLGYYVRASVISNVLKEFFAIPSLSMCQVISFGAGFDTSFFRLSGETNKNVVYYEIDLPRVVLRKIQCIQGSDVLKTIIGDFKVAECGLSSNRYHLINADLRDLKSVETLLLGAGVNLSLPTLFLSECAITYLDEAKSDSLIQWATTFPNATFITYEQIEPGDGFGTVMLQHFESLNTPLQSVKKYPSLLDQEKRYNKLGWKKCVSIPGLDAYFQYATDSEFVRVTELEPFDEWEEFHLKCCHYSLVIASQGNLKSWSRLCKFTSYFNIVNEGLAPECKTVSWDLIDSGKVQLYGHSSVLFAGKNGEMDVLIAGGFGCDEQGTHKRNKHAFTLMTKDSLTAYTIKEKFSCDSNESMFEAMHATLTLYKPNDTVYQRMILYGGRTSPENCVNVCPALVEVGSSSCVKCDPLVADISSVVPRWRHSSVIAKQHGNDMFVVFGGRSKNNKVLHDMWKINLSTEFSKRTIVQMKIHLRPRFSHSAAVMSLDCSDSDTVLISGGLDEHLSPLDDVWEIDMKTEQYHRINIKGMLPRYGHTSHIFHSTLILVGGVNVSTGHQPGICVIDLQRKVCMEYQLPGVDPEKPVMLINHSSEVSTDKSSILVIGGGGNCFSFGTFLNSHIVKIPFSQFNIE